MKKRPKARQSADVRRPSCLLGRSLRSLEPSATPLHVIKEKASIIPAKTNHGELEPAAKATEANCVLSPSSIRATMEKALKVEAFKSLRLRGASSLKMDSIPMVRKRKPQVKSMRPWGRWDRAS